MGFSQSKEPKPIPFSDTVADPRAVMIVCGDAMVASLAMLGSQRLLNVADGAVFVLNIKLYLIICVLGIGFQLRNFDLIFLKIIFIFHF